MGRLLTCQQAAVKLGVTDSRVRQLVIEGRLKGSKFGRQVAIDEDDLKGFKLPPVGRPPKR